jgi:tetratricopeptide (TPR) repeat protein
MEKAAKNRFYEAIEYQKAALEQNPAYADAYRALAEIYFYLDEFQEALRFLKEADKYARDSTEIDVLEARIRIGLGEIDAARSLFSEVLRKEPNNLDAKFGIAELLVAEGKTELAREAYLDVRNIRPESRKALLSLALLYQALNRPEEARNYIYQALRYHSDHPQVQVLAGTYFFSQGQYQNAEAHAQTALSISPEYEEALFLLGEINIRREQYENTLAIMDQLLSINRDYQNAWYLKGLAFAETGRTKKAIESFNRLLKERPGDDITRLVMEEVIISQLDFEDAQRSAFAAYHLKKGKAFAEENYFHRAIVELRRALQIDPYSKEIRTAYAELFLYRGYRAKYLQELKVIRDFAEADQRLLDLIEIYESVLDSNTAHTWQIDQFSIDKDRIALSLYHNNAEHSLQHTGAAPYLMHYAKDMLIGYENIRFTNNPEAVNGYAEAFRSARSEDSDYFILMRFTEEERSFRVEADLYLSRTGNLIKQYSVLRSGNDMVYKALSQLSDTMQGDFPLQGSIIARDRDLGIINIGSMEGLENDTELLIIRKNSLQLRPEGPGILYDPEEVLGSFVVHTLDDLIAEGEINPSGVIDLIQEGDRVIIQPEEGDVQIQARTFPPLYQKIIKIR